MHPLNGFLSKLESFAKKKRSYFGTTFSFCVDGVLERTCLHCASNGYDGVSRRRRVSIPAYTFVRPSFFSWRCYRIEPASARQQWIWRRRASSAGLDSRLYFRAVKVRFCFYQKPCRKRSRVFYRRKQLFHVYISSAPLDGEARSVVKYTYARPGHHLCL